MGIQSVGDHAATGGGVDKGAIADVDADVGIACVDGEKHEIANRERPPADVTPSAALNASLARASMLSLAFALLLAWGMLL